jgi:hypothetical protein
MRLLDIADGFSSNTTPQISALTASRLVQYISDSAFVVANGTPTGGEIYYNTASDEVRVYDGATATWKTIGKTTIARQETPPEAVNGSNVSFSILYQPLSSESIFVYLDGVLVEKTEYSYSVGVVTFSVAPNIGQDVYIVYLTEGATSIPVPNLNGQFTYYHTLTGGDISAKQITLLTEPAEPTKVLLDWVGACSQIYGSDFTVSGSVLSWSGLALDGILIAGDTLRVHYLSF